MQIQKFKPKPNPETLIQAYWLMFLRAPARPNPEVDGSFWLGEVGEDAPKTWERLTPYSLARPNV